MSTETTTTAEDKAFVAGLAKKARSKKATKTERKAKAKAQPKAAKPAKEKKANVAKSTDSKKDIILALLRRKEGATLAEMTTPPTGRNTASTDSWQDRFERRWG